MAIGKTYFYGVKDGKIAPIIADTSTTYTTDTQIDIDKVKGFSITPQLDEKEATGDNGVVGATRIKNKGYDVSFQQAVVDAATLKAINGWTETITDPGGPAEIVTLTENQDDIPAYFNLMVKPEVSAVDGDVGGAYEEFYKVRGVLSIEYQEEQYGVVSFQGKAIFSNNHTAIRSMRFFKVDADLTSPTQVTP